MIAKEVESMSAFKKISSLGYDLAKANVNSVCPWVLFTPKVPEKVKKMKNK